MQCEIPVTQNTFCIDQCVNSSSTGEEALDNMMAINIVSQGKQEQQTDRTEDDDGILHSLLNSNAEKQMEGEDQG